MQSESDSSNSSDGIITAAPTSTPTPTPTSTPTSTPTPTPTSKHKKRKIAGCVPLSADRTRCLLISSRHYPNHLVFPKGGIKRHEDAKEAAARETWEECGAIGEIGKEIHFAESAKDLEFEVIDTQATQKDNQVWFEMIVDRLRDDYPERGQRLRQWYFVNDARKLQNLRPTAKLLLEAVYNNRGHGDAVV